MRFAYFMYGEDLRLFATISATVLSFYYLFPMIENERAKLLKLKHAEGKGNLILRDSPPTSQLQGGSENSHELANNKEDSYYSTFTESENDVYTDDKTGRDM